MQAEGVAEATWEEERPATSRAIVLGATSAPIVPVPSAPSFSPSATAFIALTSAVVGGVVAWNLRDWLKSWS